MIPELQTERLILRGWRVEDFDPYADFSADVALSEYRGGAADRAAAWDAFCAMTGQWAMRGIGILAAEEKKSGQVAGYAGLWFPEDLAEPELCWSLFTTFHGYGYATEIAHAVQVWAHETKRLPPLMSFIHPENFASQRVAERLGATRGKATELRGSPRLVYRHRVPATTLKTSSEMTSKKEIEPCH